MAVASRFLSAVNSSTTVILFWVNVPVNFQLHTLLADALIGPHGQGLAGHTPDPRWSASYRHAPVDPEADLVNTPDSVFCSHGAGHTVKWDEVAQAAHVKPDPSRFTDWREATPEWFG